jgi:hypothetical protein
VVDAIFDHADPDWIATALIQRMQDGYQKVADGLLKLLNRALQGSYQWLHNKNYQETNTFRLSLMKRHMLIALAR